MAKNKNALVRYQALDKCFSSRTKHYYMDDLIEACRKALERVNGDGGSKGAEGVQRRQIYKDIDAMQLMYGVTIESHRDGHKVYFKYAGSKSLATSGPSQEEIDVLSQALAVLQRFEGVPHFDWLDDLRNRLYTTSRLGQESQKIVSFEHNQYLTGVDVWYKPIFEAITSQKVIDITYRPFGKDKRTVSVSPYHLKQYNNRWFLIGNNKGFEGLSNYAIDRIEDVKTTSRTFVPLDGDFDFDEWFGDVVGVSVNPNAPVENVVLHVDDRAFHYIVTKPLHGSQTVSRVRQDDGRWEVRLKVQDNYELRALLRSYGDEIEVMAPASLRDAMKETAENMCRMYDREM